jgi:tripartite-type tricarboxylate transporter receptor subunit TctC
VTVQRSIAAALLILLAGPSAVAAQAQAPEWPSRPLTMVVPFAAGGPVDVLGRMLAQYLGEVVGRQVVVENVTGAGGMTGSLRVAQGNPDGHTFVLGSIGTHALNQTLYRRPLYNAATDFAPVALIADVPLVLITRKDLPVRDLGEFISYAKARQSTMQFGSAGAGTSTHIGCVLLNQVIGVDITHVPYRGGGPAMVDLIGGRIDYMCNVLSTAVQPVETAQVKALATLSRERSSVMPNLATAHEQGLTEFDAYTWNAVFLPKGTPAGLVGRLNAALGKVMDNPAFRQRLEGLGLYVVAPPRRSPDYLAKFVANEIEKWAVPIRASGATGE